MPIFRIFGQKSPSFAPIVPLRARKYEKMPFFGKNPIFGPPVGIRDPPKSAIFWTSRGIAPKFWPSWRTSKGTIDHPHRKYPQNPDFRLFGTFWPRNPKKPNLCHFSQKKKARSPLQTWLLTLFLQKNSLWLRGRPPFFGTFWHFSGFSGFWQFWYFFH